MIPAMLLPLLMATPSPTMDARSEKVIELFVQVCLKGEARFAKGDVEPVASISVPWAMRVFNRPGQYYQVRRPVGAWIAVTEGGAGPDSSRICRVSAKYVDVRDAANQVRAWLREPPLPSGGRLAYYEEYFLDGGAKFEIERIRWTDLVVLHSYVLTDEAAARVRRRLGQ